MAAAFVAMNDVYGPVFGVTAAEAADAGDGERAREGARPASSSWTCTRTSCATTRGSRASCAQREAVGKAGWNPALAGKPQTLEDLKFANYFKEIYFDSDTKVALHLRIAPPKMPRDWFLTNEMKAEARAKVNRMPARSGCSRTRSSCRGMPGWMEQVDHAIATLKPDSLKGYTVGDNTNKHLSKHPWRMDDEKLAVSRSTRSS